uniref:CSON002439 protein n=1 Tax=Culicoides sonorensis TaxID=179676 RepID=A0A336MQ43_CULSO
MPNSVSLAFRPMQSCNFCRNVKEIPILSNISPEDFERRFAYSGAPVIVKDAAKNWTATEVFSFDYFRDLYLAALDDTKNKANCQFFPYKTEFKTLSEAFQMDEARARYQPGTKPWYFGWSNCDEEIGRELRQHYGRPYFLPKLSENNAVDWIFMGGSGFGAHMHVDNVRLPSWQAQIKGTKEWILAPPPECYYECSWFTVTVNKGDTIVLDTNKWFHKTRVLPGELSITIGAEYD